MQWQAAHAFSPGCAPCLPLSAGLVPIIYARALLNAQRQALSGAALALSGAGLSLSLVHLRSARPLHLLVWTRLPLSATKTSQLP
jgi:hypothetical protein